MCVCVCLYACMYMSVCVYLYIYVYISNLANIVEGEPKAPFSLATTLRCKGRCYSFPGLFHLPMIRTL